MNQVEKKSGFRQKVRANVEPADVAAVTEKSATRVFADETDVTPKHTLVEQSTPEASTAKPVIDAARSVSSDSVNVENILRALHSGKQKVAKQSDLAQLHKSLITSLQALGAGIGDQVAKSAEQDRKQTEERVAEMEKAVNGLEGLLRIQLAPEIKNMIDQSLQKHGKTKANRRSARIISAVLVIASVAFGVVFSENILSVINYLIEYAKPYF